MRITFVIAAIMLLALQASPQSVDLEQDLCLLDSAVRQADNYAKAKEAKLQSLKRDMAVHTVTPSERYEVCSRIFDEYLKYNPDSAELYAKLCQQIAANGGLGDEQTDAKIMSALAIIFHGDMAHSQELSADLPSLQQTPPRIRHRLAIARCEYYIRFCMGHDAAQIAPSADSQSEYDKYKTYLPENSWMGCYYGNAMTNGVDRATLESQLQQLPQPSGPAAMLQFMLALSYRDSGDSQMYYHYLIRSAINDIRVANCDAQSLITLINSDCPGIDVRRAFSYLMYCTENARLYRDYTRSYYVTAAHDKITRQFSQEMQASQRALFAIAILLAVVLVVCIALFCVNIRRRNRLKRAFAEIDDKNQRLQQMVEDGRQMQRQLAESNAMLQHEIDNRNQNFMDVYRMVAQYIDDVQAFKKSVFNLITAGKVEKARRELNSDSNMERYLRAFYQQFDHVFLASHPDFMERFNALLRPECRIALASPDELTPELRIYALVSIGVTDSLSIAKFLHYSPQTIYNYRLRMRHCACIPERSFAETVANLYK